MQAATPEGNKSEPNQSVYGLTTQVALRIPRSLLRGSSLKPSTPYKTLLSLMAFKFLINSRFGEYGASYYNGALIPLAALVVTP